MRFTRNKDGGDAESHLMRNAAPHKKMVPSVVAEGANILGNIVTDGILDFNGVIDGNIKCEIITIRSHGHVRGEIVADTVLVYGHVRGMIKARNVQLFAGCEVKGLVMHETISIEDGAFMDGQCKRTDKVYLNDNQDDSDGEDGFEEMPAPDVKMLENLRLIG